MTVARTGDARRAQRRLGEEGLVAVPNRRRGAVDDERLHLARYGDRDRTHVVEIQRVLRDRHGQRGRPSLLKAIGERLADGAVLRNLRVGSDPDGRLGPASVELDLGILGLVRSPIRAPRPPGETDDRRRHLVAARSDGRVRLHADVRDRRVRERFPARRVDDPDLGAPRTLCRLHHGRGSIEPPGRGGHVGQDDDPLSEQRSRRPVGQRHHGRGHAGGHVGVAKAMLRLLAGRADSRPDRRWAVLRWAPPGRRRHDARRLLRGEPIEHLERIATCAIEERLAPDAIPHGGRGIEDDRDRGWPTRRGRCSVLRLLESRARQGGRDGCQEQRARREQQELLQPEPSLGLSARAEDEIDRRERRGLRPATEEQVDDDRHRGREEAPGQRGMEERQVHAARRSRRARNGSRTLSARSSVRQSTCSRSPSAAARRTSSSQRCSTSR